MSESSLSYHKSKDNNVTRVFVSFKRGACFRSNVTLMRISHSYKARRGQLTTKLTKKF